MQAAKTFVPDAMTHSPFFGAEEQIDTDTKKVFAFCKILAP